MSTMKVRLRWFIRRDMPEVLAIEAESSENPWLEEDFIRCFRRRNCIGWVAEHDDRVVGFMVYELYKTRVRVLNFATGADYRRHGVGSQMVASLKSKLNKQRRERVSLEIPETNLSAQLFFRENGFRAVAVLRGFYEETSEDAYLMEYAVKGSACVPKNRIAGMLEGTL